MHLYCFVIRLLITREAWGNQPSSSLLQIWVPFKIIYIYTRMQMHMHTHTHTHTQFFSTSITQVQVYLSIFSINAGSISSSISISSSSTSGEKKSSSTSCNFDVSLGLDWNSSLTSALWHRGLMLLDSYKNVRKQKVNLQWNIYSRNSATWSNLFICFNGFFWRSAFLLIFSSSVLLFILGSFNPFGIWKTKFLTSGEAFKRM